MTDNKAPERVWVFHEPAFDTYVTNDHGDERYTPDHAQEYVRADLQCAVKPLDKVSVIAALEDLYFTPDNDHEEGQHDGITACIEAVTALTTAPVTPEQAVDWRGLFLEIHDQMRRAGESKEMGARWFADAARRAIAGGEGHESPDPASAKSWKLVEGMTIRDGKLIERLQAERDDARAKHAEVFRDGWRMALEAAEQALEINCMTHTEEVEAFHDALMGLFTDEPAKEKAGE